MRPGSDESIDERCGRDFASVRMSGRSVREWRASRCFILSASARLSRSPGAVVDLVRGPGRGPCNLGTGARAVENRGGPVGDRGPDVASPGRETVRVFCRGGSQCWGPRVFCGVQSFRTPSAHVLSPLTVHSGAPLSRKWTGSRWRFSCLVAHVRPDSASAFPLGFRHENTTLRRSSSGIQSVGDVRGERPGHRQEVFTLSLSEMYSPSSSPDLGRRSRK